VPIREHIKTHTTLLFLLEKMKNSTKREMETERAAAAPIFSACDAENTLVSQQTVDGAGSVFAFRPERDEFPLSCRRFSSLVLDEEEALGKTVATLRSHSITFASHLLAKFQDKKIRERKQTNSQPGWRFLPGWK
jgi:hypothetical protein